METAHTLETPTTSQAWMTMTPPPAPSQRRFRGTVIAGCVVGALVVGGLIGGLVSRDDASTAGLSERASLNRTDAADVGPAAAPPLTSSIPAVPGRTAGWSPTS